MVGDSALARLPLLAAPAIGTPALAALAAPFTSAADVAIAGDDHGHACDVGRDEVAGHGDVAGVGGCSRLRPDRPDLGCVPSGRRVHVGRNGSGRLSGGGGAVDTEPQELVAELEFLVGSHSSRLFDQRSKKPRVSSRARRETGDSRYGVGAVSNESDEPTPAEIRRHQRQALIVSSAEDQLAEAGIDRVMLQHADYDDEDMLELIAHAVIPAVA